MFFDYETMNMLDLIVDRLAEGGKSRQVGLFVDIGDGLYANIKIMKPDKYEQLSTQRTVACRDCPFSRCGSLWLDSPPGGTRIALALTLWRCL